MANTAPKHSKHAKGNVGGSQKTSGIGTVAPADGRRMVSAFDAQYSTSPEGTLYAQQPGRQFDMAPKKSKGRKIALIVLAVIVALLLAVYLGGVAVFSSLFYPESKMAGQDLSMMSVQQVEQLLQQRLDDYTIQVKGQGVDFTLGGAQTGISQDVAAIARQMHDTFSPWAWPVEVFAGHDLSDSLVYSLGDADTLAAAVNAEVEKFNATATAPQNAYVAYNDEAGEYQVMPSVMGNTLNAQVVLDEVAAAVADFSAAMNIDEEALEQPTVLVNDEGLHATADEANKLISADLALMIAGTEAAHLGKEQLKNWVTLADDGTVTFDDAALDAWVEAFVENSETVGTERTYTRPDGKKITVSGGDYGWYIHTSNTKDMVREAVKNGTQGQIEPPINRKAAEWNGRGKADWGDTYIDVDITEQHAIFYKDGEIIWETDMVSGKDGHETPLGVFYIKTNDGASVLKGYESDGKTLTYEAPVDYWMPFDGNLVGLHDCDWRTEFGGEIYHKNGSRGCINLPTKKAKELHELIWVGLPVITHE